MNMQEWNKQLIKTLNKYKINKPKTLSIYVEAFTHISYCHEQNLKYNYERLEFLGDSAIEWMIVNYLYHNKKNMNEGDMSIIKCNLVKKDTLILQSKKLNLDKLIFLGKSIDRENIPSSILEDIFESFIGAVVLDQGIKKANEIIKATIINDYLNNRINIQKDEKTKLQEIVQTSKNLVLKYKHTKIDKRWQTDIYLVFENRDYVLLSSAIGDNTSESDKLAAREALNKNILELN